MKVSLTTVGQWERNLREPSMKRLIQISRILDCSLDWLVGGLDRSNGKHFSIDMSHGQGIALGQVFGDNSEANANVKQVSEPTAKYSINKSSNFLTLINELENLNEKDLAIVIGLVKSIKAQKGG